jgi:hypothetical protein
LTGASHGRISGRYFDRLLKPRDHMQCWRKGEVPGRFHYGSNPRVPPILFLANPGWTIWSHDYVATISRRLCHMLARIGASQSRPRPCRHFRSAERNTGRTDLVTKNREYAATPSVRRSIILSQNEIAGTMFERVDDDWIGRLLEADSILDMPEIEIAVPLTELYDGIDLTPAGFEDKATA